MRRVLPYAAVAFAASLWGTWALVVRHAESIGPLPPALEAAIVMAVVTVVCGGVAWFERRAAPAGPRRLPTWKDWAGVVWFGVGDTLNMLLFFAAYKLTIAVAVLTHYMTPVLVALTAPLVLKERMTAQTAAAVGASVFGLAMMVAPSGGSGDASATWTSAALGLGSAVFYASIVLVNKFIADAFTTSAAMAWHGVFATLTGLVLVPREAWGVVDPRSAAFVAVAAIGPGALGGLAFVWGLRRMRAAHASALTLLEPLVSVLLGAAVLGERVGVRAWLGGALILAGAAAVMNQGASPVRGAVDAG